MEETLRVRARMSDGSQYEGEVQLTGSKNLLELMNEPGPFIVLDQIRIGGAVSDHSVILNKSNIISLSAVSAREG